jgi:hypothetical protein
MTVLAIIICALLSMAYAMVRMRAESQQRESDSDIFK